MVSLFYNEQTTCPNCNASFQVIKVRASKCLILERESDFNNCYQDVNPLWYSIWVCPQCQYAAPGDTFNMPLNTQEKPRVTKGLAILKGQEPDFGVERGPEVALRSMELAIRTAQLKQGPPEIFATLFLKAAWLCRHLANNQLEQKYLEEALKYYKQAFEQGRDHDGKSSSLRQMYMIGELHRRLGFYNQAVQWFSRLVSLPEIKDDPLIGRLARQQWLVAKDESKDCPSNVKAEVPPKEAQNNNLPKETLSVATAPPKPNKARTKVKAALSIYQDQWEYVQKISNQIYNQSKVLLEKEAVVRALLDALISIDPEITECETEAQLKEKIIGQIKKTG